MFNSSISSINQSLNSCVCTTTHWSLLLSIYQSSKPMTPTGRLVCIQADSFYCLHLVLLKHSFVYHLSCPVLETNNKSKAIGHLFSGWSIALCLTRCTPISHPSIHPSFLPSFRDFHHVPKNHSAGGYLNPASPNRQRVHLTTNSRSERTPGPPSFPNQPKPQKHPQPHAQHNHYPYTPLSHHHRHPFGAARCPGSVNKRTACVNVAPVAAQREGAMRLRHQTSRLVAVAVGSGYLREMPRGRRGGRGKVLVLLVLLVKEHEWAWGLVREGSLMRRDPSGGGGRGE